MNPLGHSEASPAGVRKSRHRPSAPCFERTKCNPRSSDVVILCDEMVTVELASGTKMPILGLGTWQARGRSARDAVRRALELGYRHVDTATMYANEAEVGRALTESGVPRDQV